MANWYWCKNQYGSTAASNFSVRAENASGFITYFNGRAYGTLDNPYTSILFASSPSSSWTGQNITASYTGGSLKLLTNANPIYPYALVRTTSTISNANFVLEEATTISGRYRLHDAITGSRSCHIVPVNFAIYNNTTGEYDYCNGFANTYLYGASSISTSRNTAILKSGVSYTPISLSNSSGVTVAAYANSIIDFGSAQEVPAFFKTWVENNADAIYPYTYTVKSANGSEELSTRVEMPPITEVSISTVANMKTLTLTGANSVNYTLEWESIAPNGKTFLGLAYAPNETRASVPIGQTTPVTWDSSLTLYEVYGTYRPPTTTFDINLYQNSAEVNRVDKSDYLTGVGTLSGVLRQECSMMRPTVTFTSTSVPTFNYVYIAPFGRYYYVVSITSVSKNVWRMELNCDVLHTYRDKIRALTGVIGRQENDYNAYLNDPELPAQANQNITVTEFPAGGFNTADAIAYPFVLTVVGA